jgi:hypothetical protein
VGVAHGELVDHLDVLEGIDHARVHLGDRVAALEWRRRDGGVQHDVGRESLNQRRVVAGRDRG